MPSIKQLAAVLRRAGELARKVVKDFESWNGSAPRYGQLVPEPVMARRAGGGAERQFRSPGRVQPMRRLSTLRQFSTQCQPIVSQLQHHVYKQLDLRTVAPLRHAVFMRPQVAPAKSPHSILRRPYSVWQFPTIPTRATAASVLDFELSPRILLASNTLNAETATSLVDSISGQIAHLKAVCRDVLRVSELGDLQVTLENNKIRVHFDNRESHEVDSLVRDMGLTRGVVHGVVRMSTQSVPAANEQWSDGHSSPGLSTESTLSTVSEGWML